MGGIPRRAGIDGERKYQDKSEGKKVALKGRGVAVREKDALWKKVAWEGVWG